LGCLYLTQAETDMGHAADRARMGSYYLHVTHSLMS